MYMSNLAALLEELESGVPANADTMENAGDLIATRESPLTEDELETLLRPASLPQRGYRKRLRLVRFCDNFSGDFRPFRIR
jgi:hypothetical protein